MTYASLLSEEGINSQYLVVMKPRRLVTGWTLISGTKYSKSFDYGQIVVFEVDGVTKTEATSSSLSDGQWFYDVTSAVLYVDYSANPAGYYNVATYELYFGTFDAHWYRLPTDDTTRVVYYEPIVTNSPSVKSSVSDILSGFLPVQGTNLTLSNLTHILEKHIYDSSFNQAGISVYHYLDELELANVKKIFDGICREYSYDNSKVQFSLLDKADIFTQEYRNPSGNNYYTTSVYSALDPNTVNRPIRRFYGMVNGVQPVNIDYKLESPTTSDNRDYVLGFWSGVAGELGKVSTTAGNSCTTTRTYVASVDGLNVDDDISIAVTGHTTYGARITVVGANYVDHTAIAFAAVNGDAVVRYAVGSVRIFKEGKLYIPKVISEWSENNSSGNKTFGFSFNSSLESNLSMNTLAPNDVIFCRVYGEKATSGNSLVTGNLTNIVKILRQMVSSVTSDYNTTDFTSLESTVADEVGFSIPQTSTNDFPDYKDIILDLCETGLFKIFVDDDGLWTIRQTAPLGVADKIIESDEILDKSFSYKIDYNDVVSKVIVEYAMREVSETGNKSLNGSTVSSSSSVAEYLHKIVKQKTHKSLHFIQSQASTLADRIRYYFGDRRGTASLNTKNRFFDTEIGDVITVTRDELPGDLTSIDMSVLGYEKGLRYIKIELDDQKGIEDNSGSW